MHVTPKVMLSCFHFNRVTAQCYISCLIVHCSLHELVIHGQNGMVFSDSSELSVQIQVSCFESGLYGCHVAQFCEPPFYYYIQKPLQELCKGFPDNNSQLAYFQQNLCSFRNLRWDHYWRLHVFPLVRNL